MVALRKASFKIWDSVPLFNTAQTLSLGVLRLYLLQGIQPFPREAGLSTATVQGAAQLANRNANAHISAS